MKVNQFLFGSIDENGYKVHFLPMEFEFYGKEIGKKFQFFGGIDKQKTLNTYSASFKIQDKYIITSYTIKGEDSFGRKDVLLGRGVILTLEQYEKASLFPLLRKININEIDLSDIKETFVSEIYIHEDSKRDYFIELSESINQDKSIYGRLKTLLPLIWSGKRVRLNFNEENIWLIELIYVFSPLFMKGNLSFATQTNTITDVLVFSISLARNCKEIIPTSEDNSLTNLQKRYIDDVYRALMNKDFNSYQKLEQIKSFDDLKISLIGQLTNLFSKKRKL